MLSHQGFTLTKIGEVGEMRTLHIAPSDSAGRSLEAIGIAGRDDEVLAFGDDFSCGPIASNEASTQAAWRVQFYNWPEVEDALRRFWARVDAGEDQLVVGFARHCALAPRPTPLAHRRHRPRNFAVMHN
jgi:hypothetical protein